MYQVDITLILDHTFINIMLGKYYDGLAMQFTNGTLHVSRIIH